MSYFQLAMEPPPLVQLLEARAEGTGRDVAVVEQHAQKLREEYRNSLAITDREAALAELFHSLADQWRRATRFQSSLMRAAAHPTHRAIVQLGDEVVPLLLRELRRSPEPWVLALREITGADPVRPEDRGSLRLVAEAWLRWGRDHRLI